jgi:hypothetical protein
VNKKDNAVWPKYLGATQTVAKPFRRDELLRAVDEALATTHLNSI